MNTPLNLETQDLTVTPSVKGLAERELSTSRASGTETLLPTPEMLQTQLPLGDRVRARIAKHRAEIRQILTGQDRRVLLVVGPCSIHDEMAALEYGEKLCQLAEDVSDRFLIVMRAYVEKPRTTVGWKGLLYDPERTGRGDLHQGLIRSRRLLLNLAEQGLPVATEALSPMAMDYLEDLVSWTAVGARTTESQIHREMVSGLPMPVGFKNGTDGDVSIAAHAMTSAAHSHHRLAMTRSGTPAMVTTPGNRDTHLVLRGGRSLTNYDAASIEKAVQALQKAGLNTAVMVDCSHDNARKQFELQVTIARDVMTQREAGNDNIRGLMLESFLAPGRQVDSAELVYGCSLTDPCLGWDQTEALIRSL
ncbi:3-deoxy-7-phosphoheptulonate synthase [Marinobacter salicampi]|uniref:3-deoxy-7-phosphoheptulonate synthase n=1 Tax=Marinobacter salicampi TaxID=435907 RepID=UPI00140C0634|nr:3-deoxy-7-phosphoheptulonate synthase [Marinobacter salicampi]